MRSQSVLKLTVIMAVMLMPTSCCYHKRVEPVLNGGYLTLLKGQTYEAPKNTTLVDLEVVEAKDAVILDLMRAINIDNARNDLQ